MGKGRSKEPEFVERQIAAANARKAMLEKFLAKTGKTDQSAHPAAAAAPQRTPVAEAADDAAARQVRETARPQKKIKEAERPRATQGRQKAAPDTRHAAGKTKENKTKGKPGVKEGKR